MKKANLILTFILLVSISVLGQSKVEYDFITKEPPKISTADIGTNSVFRVNRINKFLYEVKIESSQSEFNSTPPAIFSTIFTFEKKEENTIKSEADKVIENSSETKEKIETALLFGTEKAILYKNKQMLSSFNEDLFELNEQPDSLKENSKISQLNQTINDLKAAIKTQEDKITQLNTIIDNEYLKKTTEIHVNGRIVSESFDQLEEAKTIKNKLIRITLTDGLDYKKAIDEINQLTSEYPLIFKPEKLLSSFQSSYNSFKTSLQLYFINTAVKTHFGNDEGKLRESITPLSTEVEDIKKKVDKFDYTKLFEEINQLITELKNENNYFICSDPVQARKDVINYNVKISPRKGVESLTALENRNFNIEVPIKGGVKIDFSTGLFVTTNLHDRKYSKTTSTSDSTQFIITENKNNSLAKLSLGALMHISPRWTGNFKPGFTFGLGLNSTDLTNAQIFIGGSAIFGTNERFIISTGVSLANVDYLNGKYLLDTPIKNSEIETSLTEKSTRAGWFISFTYNLTNKKKE
ncbi:MAG: hypothetical protein JZU47_02520 [Prolixibacteraceae bacterium]|nr:hypothetical protein [Prolixibacteraceae bacterium]